MKPAVRADSFPIPMISGQAAEAAGVLLRRRGSSLTFAGFCCASRKDRAFSEAPMIFLCAGTAHFTISVEFQTGAGLCRFPDDHGFSAFTAADGRAAGRS